MYFHCTVIKYTTAWKTGNKSGLHYVRTVIAQYKQFYSVLSLFEIATRKNSKSMQGNKNNLILKFLCIVRENI